MAGGWEGCLCVLMWEERAGVMSALRVPARTQARAKEQARFRTECGRGASHRISVGVMSWEAGYSG